MERVETRLSKRSLIFRCLDAAVLSLLLAVSAVPAAAQPQPQAPRCFPYESLKAALGQTALEAPVGGGISIRGGLVMLFTARDGSTWTLIVRRSDGTACPITSGEGWQPIEFALPEAGAPS